MIGFLLLVQQTFLSLGILGLFLVAILEILFLPLPPDILLILLSLLNPNLIFYYIITASFGSLTGAFIVYQIGKTGRKLRFVKNVLKKENVRKVERIFKKHGYFAISISAFSPFPDNILSIAAGVLKLDLRKFLFSLFFGRFTRYMLEVFFIVLFRERIWEFITQFEILTILIVLIAVILYFIYLKIR